MGSDAGSVATTKVEPREPTQPGGAGQIGIQGLLPPCASGKDALLRLRPPQPSAEQVGVALPQLVHATTLLIPRERKSSCRARAEFWHGDG